MPDVILIEPRAGPSNRRWNWLPLGLLAVSAPLVAAGYRVTIIDQRLGEDWKANLRSELKSRHELLCVGITSMTSPQILAGLEISEFIKTETEGTIPVVWGGIHPSLIPAQTINHPLVDIVVAGEGEETFHDLVGALEKDRSLEGIPGIWYKERSAQARSDREMNGPKIHSNPPRRFIDLNSVPDPPYELLANIEQYIHPWYELERTFDIVTSRGCPYNCTFCYNTVYNQRKWRALAPQRVVDLIRSIIDRYHIRTIGFSDDNFFGSVKRANTIMQQIIDEGLDIKLYFHGIRIDTLANLSDDQLQLLVRAGGQHIQIGVESGSDRILQFINKRITADQTRMVNRRLAKFENFSIFYNFMMNFPTETEEDLLATAKLAWKLLEENPQALISPFFLYIPYPGTKLYDIAVEQGFVPPATLEEWGENYWIDFTKTYPWTTTSMRQLMRKLTLVTIMADQKLDYQFQRPFLRALARLYRRKARFHLKSGYYGFMPEARFDYLKASFIKEESP